MKFKSGINEVDLIETVGELREAIADLADDTPVRFSDPDTNWLMRLALATAPGPRLERWWYRMQRGQVSRLLAVLREETHK